MRKFFTAARRGVFFLPLLPLLPLLAAAQLVETGELPELVSAAVADNPGLATQKAVLESAREEDNVAFAPLLPQVRVGASKTLQQDRNNNGNNNNDNETRNIFVSVGQQVFNLPLWENYRSGARRVEAAESRYESALQAMRLSVTEAWLDFQLSGDLMRLAETRVETAEEQYVRAKSFAESGIGTAVDVLDAEARLAGLRADLLQNEYNHNLAQDRLYSLAGMRGRRAHLVREKFRQFPPLAPLGEWLARTAKDSHAAAAARADLAAAMALVRAADKIIYPRIGLNFETRTPGALSAHRENIVLTAEQSLFTGGQASAEARRTAANSAAARSGLRDVLRQEELRGRELHGRAALAKSRLEALRAAEDAAAAALAATSAGYEGGVRIFADVLDAEETLFNARLELRRARFNYLRDVAALRALAGALDGKFIAAIAALFIEETKEKNTDV